MDIKWLVEPEADDDDPTQEIIVLPVSPDDKTEVITMMSPGGTIVGQVRRDSIAHWMMIKNGYKVVRK